MYVHGMGAAEDVINWTPPDIGLPAVSKTAVVPPTANQVLQMNTGTAMPQALAPTNTPMFGLDIPGLLTNVLRNFSATPQPIYNAPPPPPAPPKPTMPKWVPLAALGGAAFLLMRSRKRRR